MVFRSCLFAILRIDIAPLGDVFSNKIYNCASVKFPLQVTLVRFVLSGKGCQLVDRF